MNRYSPAYTIFPYKKEVANTTKKSMVKKTFFYIYYNIFNDGDTKEKIPTLLAPAHLILRYISQTVEEIYYLLPQ